jgi:hypothetical protein
MKNEYLVYALKTIAPANYKVKRCCWQPPSRLCKG